MGKMKRARHKFHQAVSNGVLSGSGVAKRSCEGRGLSGRCSQGELPKFEGEGNIFANIPIDPNKLVQQLDQDDCKSVRSTRSVQNQIPKKDKKKLRHERFLQKLEAGKRLFEEQVAARRRKGTAIVGDLQPLVQALPELHSFCGIAEELKRIDSKMDLPKQARMSRTARRKLLEEEMDRHSKVLCDSTFQKDPLRTICDHLKNKLLQEEGIF
uniref:Family with sequence similarity 207 member A n=1 Tax=Eptatretus burgeri TaxID=7764 RepID=A0A8C4Q2Z8_EPTBU